MNSFKLTVDKQVTLPKKVRKALKLETGDCVYFNIFKDGYVGIGKTKPSDKTERMLLRLSFTE